MEIYSAPLFKHVFPQDCWALLAKCELWPPGTREQELFWQLMETRGEGSEPGSACSEEGDDGCWAGIMGLCVLRHIWHWGRRQSTPESTLG